MEIGYKPSFVRQLNALDEDVKTEARERIEQFRDLANHTQLRVHPLKGKLRGFYSFSVNYRYRIVFQWIGSGKSLAALTAIGDHNVYR